MPDDLIARMRGRVEQIRKVMRLAHDPRMIEALQKVIAEIEADIKRLEGVRDQPHEMPPPNQH